MSTLDEAGNSIELDFEMFKTQQGQVPLKQVMSAGQFNIAKTVDYIGVKVTEVNTAVDGNENYGIDELPRRSSSRPR